MLNRTLLPTWQSVSANGTASCRPPLGQKVYAICLRLGDDGTSSGVPITGTVTGSLTTAQINKIIANLIGDIRLRVNGHDQRTFSGVQLNELNGLNGAKYLAITSGTPGNANFRVYLWVFFAEFWRKNPSEVPALAWNLNARGTPHTDGKSYGNVDSFEIQVDINAGIVSPSIDGFYLWEPADTSRGIGSICKWLRDDLPAVGSKNDFAIDRVQIIQSLHLWPTQETTPKYVSTFRLNANGFDVQDKLDYLSNQAYLYLLELQPDTAPTVANCPRFDWVADFDDPIMNALAAVGLASLRMYVEYSGSAGGNMTLLTQRIGAPE